MIYFNIDVPFVKTILSYINIDIYHVTYNIEKGIVEVIIGKVLCDLEDFEVQTYENAMRVIMLDTHK